MFQRQRVLLAIISGAVAACTLHAQPVVKCGADLVMHQALTTIGRTITCTARFDFIRDTPVNISIIPSDSAGGAGLLIEETMHNLYRIGFRRDTFGVRLVFRYEIDSTVSTHYYRFASADTIVVVTPMLPPKVRACLPDSRAIDLEAGTLTLNGTVFTTGEAKIPSDIRVEMVFDRSQQHELVLANNYPALDADIRIATRYFDRDRFRASVAELDDATFAKLRYIVRFRVVRLIPGSHRYETI